MLSPHARIGTPKLHRRRLLLALAPLLLVGLVAAVAAHWLNQDHARRPAATATEAKRFALVDHRGRQVSELDFRGRLVLLYFGYTACPDLCPMALTTMAQALDELGERAREVAFLFVTVDPKRDTPAQLARYVEVMDPRLIGLSGSETATAAVAASFQVTVEAEPNRAAGDYAVRHSTKAYLLDREGRLLASFAHGTPPEAIATALRQNL